MTNRLIYRSYLIGYFELLYLGMFFSHLEAAFEKAGIPVIKGNKSEIDKVIDSI
jgi:hypothetical protein